MEIVYKDHKEVTPVWNDKHFMVSHKNAEKLIGSSLTADQISQYLGRMGFILDSHADGNYKVLVPAWRSDVIH